VREGVVGGEGFRLVLKVFGYERPSLETGADANWLAGEVELTFSTGGRFSAGSHVSLRTEELATFHEQLTHIVSALDGKAALTHMEGEVGCEVTLQRGSGEFHGFVRQHVPDVELRVAGARTDQSYLQESVRQLDAVVREFPVKGDPLA
jgi:hypothetical protein